MIGRWLQARGCRDKVVLATKVMGGSKVRVCTVGGGYGQDCWGAWGMQAAGETCRNLLGLQ